MCCTSWSSLHCPFSLGSCVSPSSPRFLCLGSPCFPWSFSSSLFLPSFPLFLLPPNCFSTAGGYGWVLWFRSGFCLSCRPPRPCVGRHPCCYCTLTPLPPSLVLQLVACVPPFFPLSSVFGLRQRTVAAPCSYVPSAPSYSYDLRSCAYAMAKTAILKRVH